LAHKCIAKERAPSDDYWVQPRDSFCGKVVEHLGTYVLAADAEYESGPLCEKCLESDDYALYLLGSVGEKHDLFGGITAGTMTGRLNAKQANIGNVTQQIKAATEMMKLEVEKEAFRSILSPTDYAALEKAVLERTGKK
jgi:hypothetical protein